MTRYLAFLRAINVGGHIVKMEALRACFSRLGLERVESFINSGNIIFESRARSEATLQSRIERELHHSLGYEVPAFLRTDTEIAEIAGHEIFREADLLGEGGGIFVVFVYSPPNAETQASLLAAQTELDSFRFAGRDIFWICRGRVSDSKFYGARLEKILGARATVRNSTTIRKLAAKYPARTIA